MTKDEIIHPRIHVGKAVFLTALKSLDELKTAPRPIPWGLSKKFEATMPPSDLKDLLESDDPYWSGYAATMLEFKELFASSEKQAEKRK